MTIDKAKSSPSTASRSRVQVVLRTRTSTPPAFRDGNLAAAVKGT